MTTDPDIIDQAEQVMRDYASAPGLLIPSWSGLARRLNDAGLLRESDHQRNERMAADAKVYADLEDARAERNEAQAEQDRLADIIKGLYETIDDARTTIRKTLRECGELRVSRAQLAIELESRRPGRLTAERDEAYAALDRVRAAADTLTWQNDYGDAQQIIYAAITGEDQS